MSDIVIFVIVILDAIVMGIVGALIGNAARGRSSAGFWWSFFLGPIGWIIVLLGADERPKCPECRGVIVEGAARCKNCGVSLVEEETPSAPHPVARIHRPVPKIRSHWQPLQILILSMSLAAAACAQGPLSGLTITAKQQKIAGPGDIRGPSKEIQLDIEVFNTLPTTNSFNLDVFFIGTFLPMNNDTQRFVRKLNKLQPSLKPMEKQTFHADSILLQPLKREKEANEFYPAASQHIVFSNYEGYIIRASSSGTNLKTIASSPALERLAKDPDKMQLLESGKTVPLK